MMEWIYAICIGVLRCLFFFSLLCWQCDAVELKCDFLLAALILLFVFWPINNLSFICVYYFLVAFFLFCRDDRNYILLHFMTRLKSADIDGGRRWLLAENCVWAEPCAIHRDVSLVLKWQFQSLMICMVLKWRTTSIYPFLPACTYCMPVAAIKMPVAYFAYSYFLVILFTFLFRNVCS